MDSLDDDAILEQIRSEDLGTPAVSYLQRRFGLPYRRAALLQARLDDEMGEPLPSSLGEL